MGRRPVLGERAANFFAMRLPDEIAARVDSYAERHGIGTRSEAIRRLVDEALTADEKRPKRETAPVRRPRKAKTE
jgi:metal-responsive CopG/Arc/MetJ family transcriptional regulator